MLITLTGHERQILDAILGTHGASDPERRLLPAYQRGLLEIDRESQSATGKSLFELDFAARRRLLSGIRHGHKLSASLALIEARRVSAPQAANLASWTPAHAGV